MKTLEIYYDYACPYCERAYHYQKALKDTYSDVQYEWHPCEAHPRPEVYGTHSDLCVRGMLYIQSKGLDLWQYHNLMYRAVFTDKINYEDAGVMQRYILEHYDHADLDAEELYAYLTGALYQKLVDQANIRAWGELDFPAVPSYYMEGRRLPAVPGVGVSEEQFRKFIEYN